MAIFVVPAQYGYVLLSATSQLFVHFIHVARTSKFRKAAKIQYPIAYATEEQASKDPKAAVFNCAQRAHANFTENLTPFLVILLISGLRYPLVSAALGALWSLTRVSYLMGYTSSAGPKGRLQYKGFLINTLASTALALMSVETAIRLVMS